MTRANRRAVGVRMSRVPWRAAAVEGWVHAYSVGSLLAAISEPDTDQLRARAEEARQLSDVTRKVVMQREPLQVGSK